jgi:hypothetical protein
MAMSGAFFSLEQDYASPDLICVPVVQGYHRLLYSGHRMLVESIEQSRS